MTHQEFFNQTLNHLRVQGEPSRSAFGAQTCLYRAPNGGKCAIGFHIPDDKYQSQMEGQEVSSLQRNYPSALWSVDGVSTRLLIAMQVLHDSNYHNLEDSARKIAQDWGLTMPAYEWVRMDWVDYDYRTDLLDNPPKHVGYYECSRPEGLEIEMGHWDGMRFRYAKNGHLITGRFQWRGLRSPAPTRG